MTGPLKRDCEHSARYVMELEEHQQNAFKLRDAWEHDLARERLVGGLASLFLASLMFYVFIQNGAWLGLLFGLGLFAWSLLLFEEISCYCSPDHTCRSCRKEMERWSGDDEVSEA